MKNGVRVLKHLLLTGYESSLVTYDYQTNLFYSFALDKCVVKTLVINNFKKGKVTFGFDKEYLSKRLNKVEEELYGVHKPNEESNSDLGNMNLIERLMFDIDSSQLITESKNQER